MTCTYTMIYKTVSCQSLTQVIAGPSHLTSSVCESVIDTVGDQVPPCCVCTCVQAQVTRPALRFHSPSQTRHTILPVLCRSLWRAQLCVHNATTIKHPQMIRHHSTPPLHGGSSRLQRCAQIAEISTCCFDVCHAIHRSIYTPLTRQPEQNYDLPMKIGSGKKWHPRDNEAYN